MFCKTLISVKYTLYKQIDMFMCVLISSIKTVLGSSILKATDLEALVRKALGVFGGFTPIQYCLGKLITIYYGLICQLLG